jgi:ribosomal protein S27AE
LRCPYCGNGFDILVYYSIKQENIVENQEIKCVQCGGKIDYDSDPEGFNEEDNADWTPGECTACGVEVTVMMPRDGSPHKLDEFNC